MAFFVNEYSNTSNNISIYASLKDGSAIYYCGVVVNSGGGYLKKLDLNGNVIWSKKYTFSENIKFTQIMSTGNFIVCAFESIYGGNDQFKAGLIALDPDGNVTWSKTFFQRNNHPVSNILTRNIKVAKLAFWNKDLIFVISDFIHLKNQSSSYSDFHLFKIANDGSTVLIHKKIDRTSISLVGINVFQLGSSIVIVGSLGIFIKLDANLNITTTKKFSFGTNKITISRIEYISEKEINGYFYARGFIVLNSVFYTFISKIKTSNFQISKFLYQNYSSQTYADLIVSGTNVYEYSPEGLTKYNDQLGIVFRKELDSAYINIKISEVVDNIISGHSRAINSINFITDLNFTSCITTTLKNPSLKSLTGISFVTTKNPTIVDEWEKSLNNTVVAAEIPLSINIICPGKSEPSLSNSTIVAQPTSMPANGSSTSLITVTLKDSNGNLINPSTAYQVVITTTAGTLLGSGVVNNGSGIYTRSLRSSNVEETALLRFTVIGLGDGTDTATVQFIKIGDTIDIIKNTSLQSPYLYLQASGSSGMDSTKGRHLRWAFRGVLGEKHLPKGNYASNEVNFNKPKDFIKIYKAAYRKKAITISFEKDLPEVVDHSNYLWIYRIQGKEFYMRFGNSAKYNQTLNLYNPLSQPYQFLKAYGDNLVELENIKDLFFIATFKFGSSVSEDVNASFKVETLSVEANSITANKIISNRKHVEGTSFGSSLRLICENGRAIGWIIANKVISSIDFEFYDETINEINKTSGWTVLGDYAITLDNDVALKQLEPVPGDVHGVWQRFNDDAFVNIQNYKDKWHGNVDSGDRNIHDVVEKYIALSDQGNNPLALENIPLGNDPNDPNDYLEISNLDLLNIASNDYHIARLLGLGILDIDPKLTIAVKTKDGEKEIVAALNPNYLYVAEYYTKADLEDGQGKRDVHHLFMSLPTSNKDNRLPIPIDLNQIIPGVFIGGMNGEPSPLTDEEGYSHDGLSRYVSLYNHELPPDEINTPFFSSNEEKNLSAITTPVFGGLEHKIDGASWQKPELSNDSRYFNAVPNGEQPHFETRFMLIPEPQQPYYVHQQIKNGLHTYSSYGINWFSRATASGTNISIYTQLTPTNPLKAPSNTSSHLIRPESPLFLTSQSEQERLDDISIEDKTLIRLFFNYHSFQELRGYAVPLDSPLNNQQIINDETTIYPDADEILAEEVEIFFRNQVPNNVRGKALSVADHSTIEILSIIETGDYYIASTNETVVPEVPVGTEDNFIGGVIVLGNNRYIIHEITQGTSGPKITVYKKQVSDSITGGGNPTNEEGYEMDLPIVNGNFPPLGNNVTLEPPIIEGDGYFMAIENMQSPSSWGNPNPYSYKIQVGIPFGIHREIIEITDDEGQVERRLEKSRGIWESTIITEFLEPTEVDEDGNVIATGHLGMYKIVFDNFILEEHPQFNPTSKSVEWYQGIVRAFTLQSLQGSTVKKSRKIFPVVRIENIRRPGETGNNLVLFIKDPTFIPDDNTYDYLKIGTGVEVNFYPGYKIYLYKDSAFGLTKENILPLEGEGMRYSIFGFRSLDTNDNYLSKISAPCVMFAQELIPATPPDRPAGPLYATRPDYFGRSTYTFTTKYLHSWAPHGVLFYRSNDEALLNALYKKTTILQVREQLKLLGGNNEIDASERWKNFLDFDTLENDGDFKAYPSTNGYKFPKPDKVGLFEWANKVISNINNNNAFPQNPPIPLFQESEYGTFYVGDPRILNFVKGYIYNAFVPLTRVPILYQYLHGEEYQPIDKDQVITDSNGYTLPPVDPKNPNSEPNGFDMAPMMKITGRPTHETSFTDFKLDGTSNNLYFYGAKEVSTQMKMSAFSPFLGPIKLVNTNAPEAPAIKRIVPVLENAILGTSPEIRLEVNAYPEVQNIRKLTIYRTFSKLEAQSIRTMQIVSVVDLVDDNQIDEPVYIVKDDFSDLMEVPYGDPLFYRVTVSREVEYAEAYGTTTITEYAPSQASKIVASFIVEVLAPQSPHLKFLSTAPNSNDEIHSVSLKWTKTAYKAKYHIYKMNNQGNWYKIYQLQRNENEIQVSLNDTDLQDDTLVLSDNGQRKYHHFKVIAENTAGIQSTEENILTIFNEDDWIQI